MFRTNSLSIGFIRLCSLGIMSIAAFLSFGHQRHLLGAWGVDPVAAFCTPITIDLLAIICTLAIHADGVAAGGRRTAIMVLVVAGLASSGANFIAGGTLGSKITNVWAVVAYLLSEWVAAKVKAAPRGVDLKRSEAAKKAAATRARNKAQRQRSHVKATRVRAAVAEGNVVQLRSAANQ